jgi:hypothetical protein
MVAVAADLGDAGEALDVAKGIDATGLSFGAAIGRPP